MFGNLTKKLQETFSKLTGAKVLTESNIDEASREVRLALLDADVEYSVVGRLVKKIKEKALGQTVVKNVNPAQTFTKIVHDELVQLMTAEKKELNLKSKPSVILMCGLQGVGKTTQTVKLARLLKSKPYYKNPVILAGDYYRPAAFEQLKVLSVPLHITIFHDPQEKDQKELLKKSFEFMKAVSGDVLIIDTAGRQHVDQNLMDEIQSLKALASPDEVLFVANAMLGQESVATAQAFDAALGITGIILTMVDSSARAGAALSMSYVTQKPILFEGTGERIDDFQVFDANSMADRILGMGDVVNLVKKAEEHITQAEKDEMEQKLRKAQFSYADFLKQMQMIRRMGPLKNLLRMLPGVGDIDPSTFDEKGLQRIEAVIQSMTLKERVEAVELDVSRRRRIAKGSGVSLDDVNKMVKTFKKLKQFLKEMPSLERKFSKEMGNKEKKIWH
jgi:signal recognition particle subunit SRP54